MKKLFSVLCLGMLSLSACGGAPSKSDEILKLSANVTAGDVVWKANCASCHGADAKGTTIAKVDLTTKSVTDSGMVSTVLKGEGKEMPSFEATLSTQQIADVIGYIKSLRK